MNYWLGVIAKEHTFQEILKTDKWFCFPSNADIGDKVVLYVTARLQKQYSGIIGIYELTRKISDDTKCKGYGSFNEILHCFGLDLTKEFSPPISLDSIKANSIIKKSQPLRRNFQGTVFKLSKHEFQEFLLIASQ